MVRRVDVWLCWITAMLAATVQVARGPVGYGYGWGAALASAVLVAVPLLVLGLAVAGARPEYAWLTLALAVVIVVFVLLALVGNWSGQSATDNTVDAVVSALAISACAGAWILEVPLLGRRPRWSGARDTRAAPASSGTAQRQHAAGSQTGGRCKVASPRVRSTRS